MPEFQDKKKSMEALEISPPSPHVPTPANTSKTATAGQGFDAI